MSGASTRSPILEVAAVAALVGLIGSPQASTADDRSTEVLRYACAGRLGRRDITLFANGTVRVREWSDGSSDELVGVEIEEISDDEDDGSGRGPSSEDREVIVRGLDVPLAETPPFEMRLDELGREDLAYAVGRLRAILRDAEQGRIREPLGENVAGPWSETCEIHLEIFGEDPFHYRISPYDIVPLEIERMIDEAESLASYARPLVEPQALPGNYEPHHGDVLINAEGQRYEVLRLTADKLGVELRGVDQPVTIYVALQQLRDVFLEVERKAANPYVP